MSHLAVHHLAGRIISMLAARSSQLRSCAGRSSQVELAGRRSQLAGRRSNSQVAGRRTQLAGRARWSQLACPNRNSILNSLKRPQLSLDMCTTISYCKRKEIEIMSSWSWFEHCSESLVWPLGSHIWSLFASIHMQIWPKVKLAKVGVGSNIAQNHSSSL